MSCARIGMADRASLARNRRWTLSFALNIAYASNRGANETVLPRFLVLPGRLATDVTNVKLHNGETNGRGGKARTTSGNRYLTNLSRSAAREREITLACAIAHGPDH